MRLDEWFDGKLKDRARSLNGCRWIDVSHKWRSMEARFDRNLIPLGDDATGSLREACDCPRMSDALMEMFVVGESMSEFDGSRVLDVVVSDMPEGEGNMAPDAGERLLPCIEKIAMAQACVSGMAELDGLAEESRGAALAGVGLVLEDVGDELFDIMESIKW